MNALNRRGIRCEQLEGRLLLTVLPVSFPPSANDDVDRAYSARYISEDGRYVAFSSYASDLVPGDSNHSADIFLRDMQSHKITLVSKGQNGQANGSSSSPTMSSDGRYVAFSSAASNLVQDDTNNATDVFLCDLAIGTISLVSTGINGQGDDDSGGPQISSNGRFVAYFSDATNLVPDDNNFSFDVFVRDLLTGTTTLVSTGFLGQGDRNSFSPSISDDGRFIAFTSESDNLVADDTNSAFDVFVHDLQSGATSLVSTGENGPANSSSQGAYISANGRFVAFESYASNLTSDFSFNAWTPDIYVRDLQAGKTTLVSGQLDSHADSYSTNPSISADGRFVAFESSSPNLVSGDTNQAADIFVRDLQVGLTTRINVGLSGEAFGSSSYPSISSDGHFVGFISEASNLATGDLNDDADVFLWTDYPAAIATSKSLYVAQNAAQPIVLTGTHAAALPLTFSVLDGPQHGVLTGVAPNLVYTPTAGYLGNDSFRFTADDGRFISAPATVTLTVVDPTPPTVAVTKPGLGDTVTVGTTSLQMTFSRAVLGADLTSTFDLQRSGIDGLWGTADDETALIIAANYAGTSTTLSFPLLTQGNYRLTVKDTITEPLLGIRLDGDSNGQPLGNFNWDFRVTPEPVGAGMRDAGFGIAGKVTAPIVGSDEYGAAVAVQSDGKILLAGNSWIDGNPNSQFTLLRYNTDGTLDESFGIHGQVITVIGRQSQPTEIALQADGKIVVVGYSVHDNGAEFALARYDANGLLDASFGSGGVVHTAVNNDGLCYAVVIQPDGKIVAGGYTTGHGSYDSVVIRYNSDGSLDTSFSADGIQITSEAGIIRALALQQDGRIVAAGYTPTIRGYDFFELHRYNIDGSPDDSFILEGPPGTGDALAVAVQPDGKIVTAGNVDVHAAPGELAIARYEIDGSFDKGFGQGGLLSVSLANHGDSAMAVALQPDGKIVAAGYATTSTGDDIAVVRCNGDGSLDEDFGIGGKLITPIGDATDLASAMRLQPDGKIVAAGYTYNGRDYDFAIVRYDTRSLAAQVVDRHLFYNNSTFDGRSTGASVADDGAVALGKTGLRSGMTASFANISSYGRGINGVMIDIARLPSQALAADDFQFHIGHDNLPTTWNVAPGPQSISIRKGAGTGGSDRVTLIWPDGLIKNEWLEITLLPNAATGLAQPHVFYFGSAVADSGTDLGHAIINITDELGARTHTTMLRNPATLDNIYDYNRDGRVNASDEILARNSETTLATAVKLITVPAGIQATASKVSSDFSDNGAAIGIAGPMNAAVKMPTTSLLATEPQPHSAGIASLEADAVCLPMIPRAQAAGDRIPPGDSEVDSDEDLYNLIAIDLIACFHDTGRIALA